jgi:hypothetical protein
LENIDGIIERNLGEVNDVLEVPTDGQVAAGGGGVGDVQRVLLRDARTDLL